MEFLSGSEGPIIPDPDQPVDAERLARTEAAMNIFRGNAERIMHFQRRAEELGRSGRDTVITLANADDPAGGVLAELLMPGHDWQQYRDAGEIPVARGLALKSGIVNFLEEAGYTTAAAELANTDDLRVVVLEAEVALVMEIAAKS